MPDEDDEDAGSPSQDLPADAKREFDRVMERLAQRVVDEAARLAAERAEGPGSEPITPSDISRGGKFVQNGSQVYHISVRERVYQGASYLAAIIVGYFIHNIDKPWGSIGFAVVSFIGLLAFVLGTGERRRGRR